MATTGSRQPCPCGSGKLTSACHAKAQQAAARLYELDREVQEQLSTLAADNAADGAEGVDPGDADDIGGVEHAWMTELLEDVGIETTDGADAARSLLLACAVYEWRAFEGTIVERALASKGGSWTKRERAWLEAQPNAWLSIWEIQAIAPGLFMKVVDCFTGEARTVMTEPGAPPIPLHDRLLGRIVDFDGSSIWSGLHDRPLPPKQGDALVQEIRRSARFGARDVAVARLRGDMSLEEWVALWRAAVTEYDAALLTPPELA